jgi:hypothetical protein
MKEKKKKELLREWDTKKLDWDRKKWDRKIGGS